MAGHLVLTRKVNQSITLITSDGPVIICVSKLKPGEVRLAIAASKEVVIFRSELGRRPAAS